MRTNSSSEIVTDVLSFFVAFSLNLYQVFIFFFMFQGSDYKDGAGIISSKTKDVPDNSKGQKSNRSWGHARNGAVKNCSSRC